jgi:phosphate starvation-inducible PhoH-like protein
MPLRIKVDLYVRYLKKFESVTLPDLDDLLSGSPGNPMENSGQDGEVLLHGDSGRKVRAITVNQKRLVEDGIDNDLLIAVGPAGTGKTYTAIAMAVKALKEREVRSGSS